MKYILLLLSCNLFLSTCYAQDELTGIWYPAYHIKEGKPAPFNEKVLWEFTETEIHTHRVGNLSTGDLGIRRVDSIRFTREGNVLHIDINRLNISQGEDSLAIWHDQTQERLVLKKLPDAFRNQRIPTEGLSGSYILSSPHFHDTIAFISDSTLIHTGSLNVDYPVNRWEVFTFRGYQILYIYDILYPLGVVKTWTKTEKIIRLLGSSGVDMVFTPVKAAPRSYTNKLIGTWRSTQITPSHEGYENSFMLRIDRDSLWINENRQKKQFAWKLTPEGNRIYFPEHLWDSEGSWKILQLTDDTLIFSITKPYDTIRRRIQLRKQP